MTSRPGELQLPTPPLTHHHLQKLGAWDPVLLQAARTNEVIQKVFPTYAVLLRLLDPGMGRSVDTPSMSLSKWVSAKAEEGWGRGQGNTFHA